jgi:very-short-patch-repair endonuclease
MKVAWNKGLTKETDSRVANYSKQLKHKIFSDEHKRKIGLSSLGRKHTDEQRYKCGNGNRNIHHTIEQNKLIGEHGKITKQLMKEQNTEKYQQMCKNISNSRIGIKPWNKDLSAKTDTRVKINSEKMLKTRSLNNNWRNNVKLAAQNPIRNKKISNARIKYFKDLTPEQMKEFTRKVCSYPTRDSYPQRELFKRVKKIYSDAIYNESIQTEKGYKKPDILLKDKKLIIEYDGLRFHKNIVNDIERDKELVEQNYKILHYRGYQPDDFEIINDVDNLSNSDINGLYKENNKTILQII